MRAAALLIGALGLAGALHAQTASGGALQGQATPATFADLSCAARYSDAKQVVLDLYWQVPRAERDGVLELSEAIEEAVRLAWVSPAEVCSPEALSQVDRLVKAEKLRAGTLLREKSRTQAAEIRQKIAAELALLGAGG